MPREYGNSTGMFPKTKSWNPFVGCNFKCVYCGPSFQLQLKRRGKQDPICGSKCYDYVPHAHEERLKRIPSSECVFVAGTGDISHAPVTYTRQIIERIKQHDSRLRKHTKRNRSIKRTYIFQSKRPQYFEKFLSEFPSNVILQTTLETNRDEGYEKWSKAPKPSVRYRDFLNLKYDHKVVTIEPIMDFDPTILKQWIVRIRPKYVWLGLNSKPNSRVFKKRNFPEPSKEKVRKLFSTLKSAGITVYLHNERIRKMMKE